MDGPDWVSGSATGRTRNPASPSSAHFASPLANAMASTDPEPHVRVEVHHAEDEARTAIRVLVIQRPAVRNAVDDTTYSELTAALADAAADASVGALILTGDGDFFTAGADLKAAMLRGPPADFTTAPVTAFMDAVLDFPKALVLAVNGPAIGIGMTILPHADFVFANATASCWVPFLSLGLVPEFGSSLTFPERMGRALAMEVLAGERRLSAEEALRVGLYGSLLPSRGSEFRRQVRVGDQNEGASDPPPMPRLLRRARVPTNERP